jgi:hypothetical protein
VKEQCKRNRLQNIKGMLERKEKNTEKEIEILSEKWVFQ